MLINNNALNDNFFWFCEPPFTVKNNQLIITTRPGTDFWQKTHYGFSRDNGHCLLTKIHIDFMMLVKTEYQAKNQYDQCGLFVRFDTDNWIKASTEFEKPTHSRLGSVVTNLGFSDWATTDIHNAVNTMWYRIQSKNRMKDFLIEYSKNGQSWKQLRIAHFHKNTSELFVGIYACSPKQGSFVSKFSHFQLTHTTWK